MFTRLEIEAAVAALLAIGLAVWLGVHDAKIKAAATAPIIASVNAAAQAASAAEAIKAARVEAEQKENLHEATATLARQDADARSLDAFNRGVQLVAARRRAEADAHAASATPGAPDMVPAAALVRSERMYARAVDAAASAARYADCLRTSGALCAADYASAVKP